MRKEITRNTDVSCKPKFTGDLLTDQLCMRYGPAAFPKQLLELHLEQMKKDGQSPIAENVLLEAVRKVSNLKGDKEIINILYALTDVSPHQSVREKAREALRQ